MFGAYRDAVDIQCDTRAVGSQVPNYSGAPLYRSVPCKIEWTSGNETYRGRKLESRTDCVVEMHQLDGIDTTMRLHVTSGQFAGKSLNISHVLPMVYRGFAQTIGIYCTETVPV